MTNEKTRTYEETKDLLKRNIGHNVERLAIESFQNQHFTQTVENAEQNGLVYLAELIEGMNSPVVRGLPYRDPEDPNFLLLRKYSNTLDNYHPKEDESRRVRINSDEFSKWGLADMYIGNFCSCGLSKFSNLRFKEEKNSPDCFPTELLNYGKIVAIIPLSGCGWKNYEELLDSSVLLEKQMAGKIPKSLDDFFAQDLKTRGKQMKQLIIGQGLKIPDNLYGRLHFLPLRERSE